MKALEAFKTVKDEVKGLKALQRQNSSASKNTKEEIQDLSSLKE